MISRIAWKSTVFCLSVLVVVGLSFIVSAPVYAQATGATLSGTVTDASGAVIPGAKLSIENTATGVSTDFTTNSDGRYNATNLLPGPYKVTASATGFSTQVRSGLTLSVGAQVALNVSMQVGQITQTVEVTGEAPAVELTSTAINSVVDATTVRELPLNGRDWTNLSTLQPGVLSLTDLQSSAGSGFGSRGSRGFGNAASVSGTRPGQNVYRIDGISVNDFANSGPGSVTGYALGVDAIAEFSLVSSNSNAEFGRTAGGVINAITRSGTGQFHGSVFEFDRNSVFDAANFFDPQAPGGKPHLTRNQFGGTFGGPVWKEHTFFFVNYEGFRQSQGHTELDNTLSPNVLVNHIVTNANGSTQPVDPTVIPFLGLWPAANGPLASNGNTGKFNLSYPQTETDNFGAARLDHKFSEKDNMFGSYQYDSADFYSTGVFGNTSSGYHTGRQFVALQENHIFSSRVVNSFRVGVSRTIFTSVPERNVVSLNPLICFCSPVVGGMPAFTIPGFGAPGISASGVTSPNGNGIVGHPFVYHWNAYQAYDDVSITKGKHTLKIGGGMERDQNNMYTVDRATGLFTFGSVQSFLENAGENSFVYSAPNPSARDFRQSIYGAYVQDNVQWRSNLTLNLGLRYEYATEPTEVLGQMSNLRQPTDPAPHVGDPIYGRNPTRRNFEPRVGFAWDPFRNSKTSVRGSFGIFDVLPLVADLQQFYVQEAPFTIYGQAPTTNNIKGIGAGTFPTLAYANGLAAPPAYKNAWVEFNPKRDYLMQWNLNIQRQLTPNLTLTVQYVGDHGVHQPFRADDSNMVIPTLTAAGYMWPTVVGSQPRLNPNVSRMDTLIWDESNVYHGGSVSIQKRFSHGLQAQASYTFSKGIDEGSGSVCGDCFANSMTSEEFFSTTVRRGPSDFNVTHNMSANFIWEIPSPLHGAAEAVVGGWQLGGILSLDSGNPFTPQLGGDPNGKLATDLEEYPDRVTSGACANPINPESVNYINTQCLALPSLANHPGATVSIACTAFTAAPGTCANLRGDVGRNSFIGPGLANYDSSLFKNFHVKRISETFNVQFRFEVFNTFNRVNFHSPSTTAVQIFNQAGTLLTSTAGVLTATATDSRHLQFGMKVIF